MERLDSPLFEKIATQASNLRINEALFEVKALLRLFWITMAYSNVAKGPSSTGI